MEVSRQILFFFSALGAFNGLLLAIYLLFFLRPARLRNRLLGLLLLALSIRIGKSVFLYFDSGLAREFLQFGLTACFFIGPLLLAYVKASRDGIERVPKYWWGLFAVLAAFILGIGWWRPYGSYPEFWNGEFSFVRVIYNIWSVFLVLAAYALWPVLKRWREWNTQEVWLVNVFVGNTIVHLAYRTGAYTSYIVGALSFSLVFYLLGLWYFLQRREKDFLVADRPKYGDRKMDDADARRLVARADEVMQKEQLYLQPDLKLPAAAAAAGVSAHQLSQALNDNLGQSFSTYLKSYRVRHAQAAMRNNDHLTLEAIGLEAGFGSKSAFYAAFKEIAGMTPAAWKKQ
ncbi:MAG: helix-turn-helix domain-containing protein [Bacteroidota bacterium]